jgi:TRAP-type C4-dicarboxylate transport system substrate-binding protein
MKRMLFILLSLLFLSSLVFSGCGAPDPSEVITLRYGNQNPETGWDAENAAKPTLQNLSDATNGMVQFETYFGSTLYAPPDAWESVKTGVADVAWTWAGFKPGITSLADVIALPHMPFKSAEQASGILWKLYEEFPAIAEQYNKEVKVLFLWVSTPYFLITTDKQVKTLADLEGLIIRAGGGPPTDQFTALGAVPKGVGMPGTYEALQKGVIDGMAIPSEALYTFRQYEVAPYITYLDLHSTYFAFAFNWDTWNSLPSDIQKDLTDAGGLEASKFYGKNMFDTSLDAALEAAKAGGYEVFEYTLPDSEVAKWREMAGEPLWEKWVADREAEGYSEARDILNRCLELIETYNP